MTDEELIKRASDQATEIAALRKRVAGLEDRIGILHEHMAADGARRQYGLTRSS